MTPNFRPTLVTLAWGTALLTLAQSAAAQALPDVVVTATRTAQPSFDIGASVDVVTGQTLRSAGPLVNLSEALTRVPGLSVLNRQNYAQDLQISSRGFGARSTFGVRGVRLYADGIPLTMPDGQGQASSIDLGSAQRIEVLRGPMSALYGNAAGGVIQVFTEDGPPTPEVTVGYAVSRDGFHRESVKLGGETGPVNYVINASHFETDGFRDHSAAQRDQINAKLKWSLQDRSTVTVVGSYLNMPQVQDPLGLTKTEMEANRKQATGSAYDYNTRKDIANRQLGVVYDKPLSFGELRLLGYTGTRQVVQFQSIPLGAQGTATHPGGVIDLDRDFSGLDARLTWRTSLAGQPLSITGGLNVDRMDERRAGYQNFTASGSVLGVQGALRRDEDNRAQNSDQYLQTQWDLSEQWVATAGVRQSKVTFRSQDHYVVVGNPDDSGRMGFSATSPVLGLMWKPSSTAHLYVTAGQSFETPTLNEVAYKTTDGSATGWNTGLKASQGRHLEVGLKQALSIQSGLNVAVFQTDTDDEIGVSRNERGRSSFQNVGRTRRLGAEASLQWRVAPTWSVYTSAAWMQARYRDSFQSTAVAGATTTTVVPVGNDLPGVPSQTTYAELLWRPTNAWQLAVEARHTGRIWANDINTEAAASYTVWAMRAGWTQALGDWRLNTLLRIDNVTDQHAVGSVIVNEGNKRYYEPSPGRSALLSVQVSKAF
ncbi:TonB-dependent receptor [Aquabacterium sp.]|uniref:TonB-dependent receptor family protein n=1 Tax=Aquabacterium sp. TaxID=1872578 RepID=UPI002486D208|nr:TonB-dependent receptor [Aquabacterium sp.]MDI1260071.1 TonB-dependent receptor [Aquabacterium sp.]